MTELKENTAYRATSYPRMSDRENDERYDLTRPYPNKEIIKVVKVVSSTEFIGEQYNEKWTYRLGKQGLWICPDGSSIGESLEEIK